MTLEQARNSAIDQSIRHGHAVQHINCTIRKTKNNSYEIDQEAFYISDWCDGSTVESYTGERETR